MSKFLRICRKSGLLDIKANSYLLVSCSLSNGHSQQLVTYRYPPTGRYLVRFSFLYSLFSGQAWSANNAAF